MKRKNNLVLAALFLLIMGGYPGGAFAAADEKAAQPVYYHYNAAGKPDPFKPFVDKEMLAKQKTEKAAVSIFPLQKAGVDQFNLVGIMISRERKVAIVETKDGKGRYPVALGTIIGMNKGKVVDIKSDQITIEEVTQGRTGKKANRIIKKLRRDE